MQNKADSFDFNKLAEIFTGGSDADREAAVNTLVEIGEPAVAPIINYLKMFGAFGQVKHACDALIKIGEPAIEPLTEAMSGGGTTLQRIAVDLLEKIGGPGASSQMVAALSSSDPATALAAADALVEMGWQPDKPELEARYLSVIYLYSPRRDTGSQRQLASEKLRTLEWEPGNDEVAAAFHITNQSWENCVQIGLPAVKPLFITLQDPDDDLARSASKTLIEIGTDAVDQLLDLMDRYFYWCFSDASGVKLRIAAANVLGNIGDARAVPTLIKMGSNPEKTSEIREAAAIALAAIGTEAVETLIEACSSEQATTQHLAASALGQIGDKRAFAALIPLLSKSAPHHKPFVRHAAREALTRISGEDRGAEMEGWQSWLETNQ